jgi:hypothetical protein
MRKIVQYALLLMVILTFSALPSIKPSENVHAQVQATSTRTPTPVNIGNFVWDDLDQDGTQDSGEPGIAGVTVQLWNSTKTQLLYTTVTNANGNYSVIAPTPGNYRVRVILLSGMDAFSPKNAAINDQTDSDINPSGVDLGFTDVFNIASNVISTTIYDAGIIVYRAPTPTRTPTPINIGNFVWHDLDADGIQDAGEPGVAGITVQLWNSGQTLLIDSTTINANGIYSVIAPIPGDYRIRVVPFPGSSFSPKNQGVDDTRDSDINTNFLLQNYGFSDVFTLANNVISTTIHDAGLTVHWTCYLSRAESQSDINDSKVYDENLHYAIYGVSRGFVSAYRGKTGRDDVWQ